MFNPNECVHCRATLKAGAKFCSKCGTPAPRCEENHCTNPRCERCSSGFSFGPDDLYCDECGKPTTLGKLVEDLI